MTPNCVVDCRKINAIREYKKSMGDRFPKYAVFIVAYNAFHRLVSVVERIPPEVYDLLKEIYIFDDFSQRESYDLASSYLETAMLEKVSLYRNHRNYGYGGNQKLGFEYAIAKGFDYVILLHGDGQYAPESLPDLMLPTLEDDVQVVMGSRMLKPGEAIKGNMPAYKFVGNRVLTVFENTVLRMSLTEFHSGYRLYGTRFLKKIRYKLNTDDFHFDTQIIIQTLVAEERIVEVPIPTYYGDEICHVNGMTYALNVVLSVIDYRLHQLGLTRRERYIAVPETSYAFKDSPYSSHYQTFKIPTRGSKVLDLGCGPGHLAQRLKHEKGCHVTGVDILPKEEVFRHLDEYLQIDLSNDEDLPFSREFDYVLLNDVLEHVATPEKLLAKARKVLKENGLLIISLPNVALWVNRLNLLFGRFMYANRGIMDRTHLRFYTLVTARHLLQSSGLTIEQERYTPIPFHLAFTLSKSKSLHLLNQLYQALACVCPRMFAYQFIFLARSIEPDWGELRKRPVVVEHPDREPPHGRRES